MLSYSNFQSGAPCLWIRPGGKTGPEPPLRRIPINPQLHPCRSLARDWLVVHDTGIVAALPV